MIINQVVSGGGSSAPAHYIDFSVDANGKLVGGTTVLNVSGATDIGNYALYYKYYSNTNVSGAVDFSSLTSVSGTDAMAHCFDGCTGITSVDLSSLTTVSGSLNGCFYTCTGITSIDLSSLTTVSGNMGVCFQGCTGLTSVDLSSLTTLSGVNAFNGCFRNCHNITSVDMSALTTISGSSAGNLLFAGAALTSVTFDSLSVLTGSQALRLAFSGCSNLTSLSFPSITTTSFGAQTNQFENMCQGTSGITLHFPSNVQSVIEGLTGYSTTAPFGATSGTVAFDLPATE